MYCELDNNHFAVSTATALLFDTACQGDQLFASSTTMLNTSITQAIQSTTIYGGKGSKALFDFNYQKEISVTLEDSVFNPNYLAAQNGTSIAKKMSEVFTTEEVVFDATGKGSLKNTPEGNVQVPLDGKFTAVLATGKDVVVPALAGKTVNVTYAHNKLVDTLSIDASTFPKALKLVLTIDIFDKQQRLVEQMQITIPNFKPDGNMEISLTHDGVATSSISGKALICGDKYATITFIPVQGDDEATCLTQIVTIPSKIEFDDDAQNETRTLTVLGVRGLGNTLIPNTDANLEFNSTDPDLFTVTDGVVTFVGTSTATTGTVEIKYTEAGQEFIDAVTVSIV